MASNTKQQLHWTQRVALIRHNLHAASRSNDFGFFKTLQAAGLMEGTNHFATLTAVLGDESDALLAGLDSLNAGLGYVHQDAFKNVYDNLKNAIRDDADDDDDDDNEDNRTADKSKLYVDIRMQKNMADLGIDKLTNSAIALIEAQPAHVQEEAANIWVTGVTLIADCMEVSLKQMDGLEHTRSDFIRMEESWNTVKASVVAAVTGLKGVFSLMDTSTQQDDNAPRAAPATISSAGSAMFRRLSSAFVTPPHSRNASTASTMSVGSAPKSGPPAVAFGTPQYRTPNYVRGSVSSGCPTKMPTRMSTLAPIPPTPHVEDMDPFDTSFAPTTVPPINNHMLLSQPVM